jgi:hypothetical protein
MSSETDGDVVDYVNDQSGNEEGTLFLPCPDGKPDRWSIFFIGILFGIAGAALVPLSLWLAGAIICVGYGLSAFTLRDSCGRLGRAIRFGLLIPAILGAALVLGEMVAPETVRRALALAGDRPIIFPSFALMPWILGMLRYAYSLMR